MHDTNVPRHFAENYRFLSYGCVRVEGIYELAAWLLAAAGSKRHWDPETIADAVRAGEQKKIRLSNPLPVEWVYLDAWKAPMAWFTMRRMSTASTALDRQ